MIFESNCYLCYLKIITGHVYNIDIQNKQCINNKHSAQIIENVKSLSGFLWYTGMKSI